jgi:hypothetical protein
MRDDELNLSNDPLAELEGAGREEARAEELEEAAAMRGTARRRNRRGGKRLVKPREEGARNFSPEQRLLILDTWRRSGLPAGDFAALVGMSKHTLYGWKKAFDRLGPAGLMDQPRGAKKGSRLPEITQRAILENGKGSRTQIDRMSLIKGRSRTETKGPGRK